MCLMVNTHLSKLIHYIQCVQSQLCRQYIDNVTDNDIRGDAGVFIVNFTTCIRLMPKKV